MSLVKILLIIIAILSVALIVVSIALICKCREASNTKQQASWYSISSRYR